MSIDYRFILCVCVACFIERLQANDKNPLHQKEPEGFAGFDEQLHFLSLQTEYYDPEWGQQPNGDVYGLFTGGAFKNMNMWTRLLAYVRANWAVVTGVLSADAVSVAFGVPIRDERPHVSVHGSEPQVLESASSLWRVCVMN